MNRAAEARLDAERADAALIDALLQAEPDVLHLNRVAEARLDAEHADAAASRPSCRRNRTSWT